MRRKRQLVLAVHAAYVLILAAGAAWIALVLGQNDPNDDWMISARAVFWPIAAVVAGIAVAIAVATKSWLRTGRRGLLFAADMVVPVLALLFAGPLVLDPSFIGDFPGLAVAVVISLVCGGVVAGSPSLGRDVSRQ